MASIKRKVFTKVLCGAVAIALIGCPQTDQNDSKSLEEISHLSAKEKKYFSSSYEEARVKFLAASRTAGATIENFKNPKTGPLGHSLYADVAILGPKDAKTTLVLQSGTHGVEGFAGSAIQTGLLLNGLASQVGPNFRVVFIHALNPYGFSHLRRMNEDNIDLNRNFIDHSKPYPQNKNYDALADTIELKSYSFWSVKFSLFKMLWYKWTHGEGALQAAVSRGQYTHPKGLFYGGRFKAWSNKTLREILGRYMSGSRKVVFIDFHTGLGSYGNAEIILNVPITSPAYQRAVKWWGHNRTKSTKAGESVSPDLTGTLKLSVPAMIPHAEVTAVSLEFGTVPPKEVFQALQSENWLHHHGGKNYPRANEIKAKLLRAFYPNTDDWNARIWAQGKEIVEKTISILAR
jgi:hypothetical protein